jgi:hypothetical protein
VDALITESSSNHGHVLVVPRSPGPLLELAPSLAQRDDLDELLDDLFGEPLTDGPGVADVALVVLGFLGVALGVTGRLGTWACVAGAIAVVLGLVLPVRALAAGVRRRRDARGVAATLGSGTPLDASDERVVALVRAYSALLAETDLDGPSRGDARDLAHQTVLEVATLLRGRPPQGEAEREFVRSRTHSLLGLTADLARARQDSGPLDAAVEAVERLDEVNGSVQRIEAMRVALRGEER